MAKEWPDKAKSATAVRLLLYGLLLRVPEHIQFLQELGHFRCYIRTLGMLDALTGNEHQTTRLDERFQISETLPNQSPSPVADHCFYAEFSAAYNPCL